MKRIMLFLTCLFLMASLAMAQSRVTGVVTSAEDGEPIVGASVLVKGTTVGTVTDLDGKFTLTGIPSSAKTLTVSYVGMRTREVAIRSNLSIILESDEALLDEVMVVAYGTTRRSAFTGSAVVVDEKTLKTPAASADKALQGKIAGVQVISNGGQPGSGTNFRVRGSGSLSASNQPLIVIDGVATTGTEYSEVAYSNDQSSNILAQLNPNDIESITVLKDAAAAALYGSRAANGVILVTTKSGKSGKSRITFDSKFSWSSLSKAYDTMSSAEMYKTIFDLYNASGRYDSVDEVNAAVQGALTHNPYNVGSPLDANGNVINGAQIVVDTDWQDEVFNTGFTQDYSMSVSGGNDKTTHFFSVGYLDQGGIAPAGTFERYSAKAKIDSQVNDWLKAGLNANFSYSKQSNTVAGSAGASPLQNALHFPNAVPVYMVDANGNPILDAEGNKQFNFINGVNLDFNPIAIPYMDKNGTKTYHFLGNAYLQVEPIKGLTLRTEFKPEFISNDENEYWNKEHGNGPAYNGRIFRYHTTDMIITSTNTLGYDKTFGDHHINALLGMEYYKSDLNYLYVSARDILGDFQELDAASSTYPASSYNSKEVMISYFGRAEYSYDDRYNASVSLRRDGSSVFGADKKWGNFWSVGAGWRINQEAFMKDTEWVDQLKLRASYGTSGNKAGIGRYASLGLWGVDETYNGSKAAYLRQFANSNLSWESQKMFNVGVDFGFFNRIWGSVDFFKKTSDGLLYDLPVSSESGLYAVNASITMNAAKTSNSGIEVVLGASILPRTSPLTWTMELNASMIKDKIEDLYGDNDIQQTSYQKIWSVGGSQYEFYMPTWAGVDPSNGDPLWYVVDANGNRSTTNVYSQATYERQGRSTPTVYGGWNNTFNYKNFDLSIMAAYQIGGKIYDGTYKGLMHDDGSYSDNWHRDLLNAWSASNTRTDVPRLGSSSSQLSTRFLYDASYLKIKTVTLGYTLPRISGLSNVINNLRVYVSVDNLFTKFFSDYQGYDDIDIFGVQGYSLYTSTPSPRTWTVGASVTF